LAKLIWPADLAVFYPPEKWAWWQIGGAAAVLAAITAAVVWLGCKEAVDTRTGKGSPPFALRPSPLLIGWFWFLGMLVPVIGLVQVGAQAMADRYSYLPSIGLFVALVWALGTDSRQEKRGEGAALWNGRGAPGVLSIIAVSLLLAAFAIRTHIEAKYWHDSETLFRRALAVTSDNEYAEFSLGNALCDNGQTAEGLERLQKVLAIDPTFAEVEARVAFVLAGQGKYDEALRHYKKAMESRPDLTGALNNLAWMRATHPDARYRDGAEAVQLALRACELTHYEKTIFIGTLAAAYAEAGRFAEAAAAAQRAIDHALAWKENDLAQRNRQLLELYRAGKAYHEGSTK
jgi:Tfp pilus assembly protein PilF